MEIRDILKELEYLHSGIFPLKAVKAAIANKEEITPYLLDILINTKESLAEIYEEETYMAHIYALYLLAQFREVKAYPIIVDLFSIPGEKVADITGDLVTEDLHRIIASVYDGDSTLIKLLIANKDVFSFTRGSALEAFLIFYVTNEMSRSEVVDYYKNLFNGGLEREYSEVWDILIDTSSKLYPDELIDDIRQAYSEELADPFFIGDLEYYEDLLKKDKELVLKEIQGSKRYKLIDDTIKEMQWWACFDGSKRKKKINIEKELRRLRLLSPPIVGSKPKVGRNAPCPCGSGKKYKKCCGKNI